MSETLRNALTTILYHTGTPTSQFMMVIATNRPGDLDSAVLDRLDESVEFGLPDLDARKAMVELYFDAYISKPLSIEWRRSRIDAAKRAQDAKAKAKVKQSTANATKDMIGKKADDGGRKIPFESPLAAAPAGFPADSKKDDIVDETALAEVARRVQGFSGREIAKLFTSLQTHVLYGMSRNEKGYKRLPKPMLFEVVDSKVKEHERTAEFQVSGYNYIASPSNPPSMPHTPAEVRGDMLPPTDSRVPGVTAA